MPRELVKNGDFSKGDRAFDSDLVRIDGAPGSDRETTPAYDIDRTPRHAAISWDDWARFGDHTTGDGKMMVVTGGEADIWREDIPLHAGTTYTFSYWARFALDGSNGLGNPPVLQIYVDRTELVGSPFTVQGPASQGWQQYTVQFTPTHEITTVAIRDLNDDAGWNDFCLDDISIKRSGGGDTAVLRDAFGADTAIAHHDGAYAAQAVTVADSGAHLYLA